MAAGVAANLPAYFLGNEALNHLILIGQGLCLQIVEFYGSGRKDYHIFFGKADIICHSVCLANLLYGTVFPVDLIYASPHAEAVKTAVFSKGKHIQVIPIIRILNRFLCSFRIYIDIFRMVAFLFIFRRIHSPGINSGR